MKLNSLILSAVLLAALIGMPVQAQASEAEDKAATLPANEKLYTREWFIWPKFFGKSGSAVKYLKQRGVSFPAGSSASYDSDEKKLIVRNNLENLNKVSKLVEAYLSRLNTPPKPDDSTLRKLKLGKRASTARTAFPILTVEQQKNKDGLEKLQLGHVNLKDCRMTDALDYIRRKGRESGILINFVLHPPPSAPGEASALIATVTLDIPSCNGTRFLDELTQRTGHAYFIHNECIIISPKDMQPMSVCEWYVSPVIIQHATQEYSPHYIAEEGIRVYTGRAGAHEVVPKFFAAYGIEFPKGSRASYHHPTYLLQVRNTNANLKKINDLLLKEGENILKTIREEQKKNRRPRR